MKIPFFSKKLSTGGDYFGLFLKEEEGIAMIISQVNGKVFLKAKEKFSYTNGWENLTEDVDGALYRLEKNLNTQIKKVIFFVYSHLIDEKNNEIKKPYLQKIKELVKSLDLEALGYIECFEAVSLYLEEKEEIALTALVVEFDRTQLAVFIYKGGKINEKIVLARTDNIINDLTQGFDEFRKKTILPTRIILYDSYDLDDISSNILSFQWNNKYFVQLPKVDILKEDEVIEGLINVFKEQLITEKNLKEEKIDETQTDVSGFVINKDIGEEKKELPMIVNEKVNIFARIKLLIDNLSGSYSKISLPKIKINLSGKILLYIGVILIIASLAVNELFFHRAEIVLYLPSQKIKETAKIEINYRVASSEANFSETINTSGKQEVGNKAQGQVTIYNSNLSSAETLPQGTLIVSPNNLKFVLGSEVKVASATGDASSSQPATAKVSVVAEGIGEEYNLAANTKFPIEGKSKNLLAENDSAFTGGSKKQIQTVAKKDQEDLKGIVLNKAKKESNPIKPSSGEIVVAKLSQVKPTKLDYSKEVGEEADKISLKATITTTNFLYHKKDLIEKMAAAVNPQVNQGFVLEKDNLSYNIIEADVKDNQLVLNTEINGKAIKDVSVKEIAKKILGKNKKQLDDLLKKNYQIQGYHLVINEPLPVINDYLPFFQKNLNIKISSL